MADDGVIDEYFAHLARSLVSYRYKDRVLSEFRDHIEQRVQELTAAGYAHEDACTAAIAALGDPESFSADFASVRAMPTAFTRRAGLIGLCGAPLLAVGFVQPSDGNQVPWLLLLPFAAFVTGFLGVIARTRGSFGRARGGLAVGLIAVGGSIGWVGGYGVIGLLCAVAVVCGFALLLHATYRVGALPRPATLTVVLAGLALVALIGSDVDEASPPVYAAGVAVFVGWCWLLYTLWAESPAYTDPPTCE